MSVYSIETFMDMTPDFAFVQIYILIYIFRKQAQSTKGKKKVSKKSRMIITGINLRFGFWRKYIKVIVEFYP